MSKLIFITLLALITSACTKDADGVPKITDTESIIVDGQEMTADEFYAAYCKLKPTNDTCIAVANQQFLNDSKRTTAPRF